MSSGCGSCLLKLFILFFIIFIALSSLIYFYTDGIKNLGDFIVEQLPAEFDKEIGQELHKEILSEYKEDKKGSILLMEFFHELNLDKETRVHVLKSNEFNAFAIPGNNIYIFSNVLEEIESSEELAALLVHEYAHIKYRHGMKNLAEALLRNLITEVFFKEDKGLKTLVENANLLLTLENSREMEIESDLEAFRYFREKKLNKKGLVDLYKRLEEIQEKSLDDIPAYLSTHPDSRERYKMISDSLNAYPYKAIENESLDLKFNLIKGYLYAKKLLQLVH